MKKINLKAMSEGEIAEFLESEGLPAYRARQLMQWIYERGATGLDEISVFSKKLKDALNEQSYISALDVVEIMRSADGTVKILFALEDGLNIESVLIPDGNRLTICVSSQVGCRMGCAFCRTASMKFRRNLEAFEIVDQLVMAKKHVQGRISNIVFMGMGEPLLNVRNVAEAIVRINSLMKVSRRRITVSTCGIPKGILELPRLLSEHDIYVNLAVSLNATTDDVRSRIMPVNRRHGIAELMKAVRKFPIPKTRKITFEYVLIDGVNNTRDDAARLARLLRGIPNKVNIIPLNPFEGSRMKPPGERQVNEFCQWLEDEGVTALVRKSKGQDILASCGQLAAREALRN